MSLNPHRRSVISFLSPSSAASGLAQERLASLLGWKEKEFFPTPEWNRVALECPQSGTTLQWLSLKASRDRSLDGRNPFRLLAIQETTCAPGEKDADFVWEKLQTSLDATKSATRMTLKKVLWQPVSANDLLGRGSLPVIQWDTMAVPSQLAETTTGLTQGALKEIAIPANDSDRYVDGRTLREYLGSSPLHRPVTGLYRLASGISLRPLPISAEDRQLPPPSLVFHVENLHDLPWYQENEGDGVAASTKDFEVHKIGYNGVSRGQLMVRSHAWLGMDVRFCQQTKPKAVFAEAQEALLAGSLPSLQSQHVLDGAKGTIDPRTNRMDCWVEFRANLKNPLGFWSSKRTSSHRIAKTPDLPYE